MNATQPRRRALGLVVAIASAYVLVASQAEAAPIRHGSARILAARPVHTSAVESMNGYFLQAMAVHQLDVRIPSQLRKLQTDNGLLHESAFVSYLRWRRGLNPARFDRYHPYVAQAFLTDKQVRTSILTPPKVVYPTSDTPKVTPIPQSTEPPKVPEPATWLMALGLLALGRRLARR